MKTALIWLLLAVGLLGATPVAAELTSDQFAYGLPLVVSGAQAFYELELPLAVYQGSLRHDLGDIRVFNGAGKVVPHALRRPANQTRQRDVVTTELPFFPLSGRLEQPDADLSIHVERTAEGTIVDVRADSQTDQADAREIRSYLLDCQKLKRRIDSLELLWADDTPEFLAEIVVETSHDLVSWKTLTTAAVARLSYQGFRLDQNKLSFPQTNRRYLRLSWPVGQPAAELRTARVLTRKSTLIERPAQRHLTLTAEPFGTRRYRADLLGALPVTSVTIMLPEHNALATMRLHSSDQAKGAMQQRWRGLAYNLTTNGHQLSNPAIKLSPTRQRYWDLTLDASESTLIASPQLEFSWQPDRLVFLAQGEGPYYVAYGSKRIEPTDFHVDQLLKSAAVAARPQLVQPGPSFVLGGEDILSERSPLPWKKFSLWGVLLLGVLLIGGLSFSLYRKLQDSGPQE